MPEWSSSALTRLVVQRPVLNPREASTGGRAASTSLFRLLRPMNCMAYRISALLAGFNTFSIGGSAQNLNKMGRIVVRAALLLRFLRWHFHDERAHAHQLRLAIALLDDLNLHDVSSVLKKVKFAPTAGARPSHRRATV
jgi:hypothetical protein